MLGVALAGLDRAKDAVHEGERAVALLPYPSGGSESTLMPANLARIYVLLGQQEKAIDELAIVFSRPGPLSPAWLESIRSGAVCAIIPASSEWWPPELGVRCELNHSGPPDRGKV